MNRDLAAYLARHYGPPWQFDPVRFWRIALEDGIEVAAEECLRWCAKCRGAGEIVHGHPNDPDARREVCECSAGPVFDCERGRA